ncbi:hypothetical protein MMC29_001305 [Sticta canariensis]|nr:hypothetical protein [Sticta canariensis]
MKAAFTAFKHMTQVACEAAESVPAPFGLALQGRASALAQDVSELTKAQLANAQKQLRGVRAPEIKSPLSDSSTAQHEPVPDAQHQVAMQKATGQELPDRDSSSTDAIERSPAVRVNMASQGDGPDLLIKSTTPSAVFFMTIAMAACSGLGAVPFFFVGALSKEWAALANAVACGVMLAASFDLLHEGQPYGAGFVILGLLSDGIIHDLAGAMFINASQERLQKFEDVKFEGLQGASARKIVLVVGIMAAHALGEGSGVGVSFCGNRGWAQVLASLPSKAAVYRLLKRPKLCHGRAEPVQCNGRMSDKLGLLVTLAIGLHNIPEGLAVATVLVARGISAKHAFWWTIFTSMPQPLLALPSFVFVETFRNLLPLALGFAAGCMLWMVFAELLPDALEDSKAGKVRIASYVVQLVQWFAERTVLHQVATAATFSAAWLEALRMMLAGLEQPDGGVAISFDGDFRAGMHASAMLLLCTGACAAVTGGVIAAACTPAAVTLGTAAGLVSFMGGADLAYQLVSNPHTHVTGTVLAAIVGACGAVLAYRWGLSQTSTGIVDKAKKDVESLQESANGRNGDWHVLDEAGRCGSSWCGNLACSPELHIVDSDKIVCVARDCPVDFINVSLSLEATALICLTVTLTVGTGIPLTMLELVVT